MSVNSMQDITKTAPAQTQDADVQEPKKPANPYKERTLAPYSPPRSMIQEFAGRLRNSLSYKNADKLTDHELLALATASLAYGLNPYLGELWALPGLGLMVGRSGWVKKLSEMADDHQFTWWPSYNLLQHSQYEEYSIPNDAQVAFMCEIRRSDWLKIYTETLKDLSESIKLDPDTIIKLLGNPPVLRGVGFIGKNEAFGGSTMPLAERAKKRAFAQACREIVYLPFDNLTDGDVVNGQIIDAPMVIEGSTVEQATGDGDEKPEKPNGKEQPSEAPEAKMPARPMSPMELREYFEQATGCLPTASHGAEALTEKQERVLINLLKGLFKDSATANKDRDSYLKFMCGIANLALISRKAASTLIDLLKCDDADDWSINPLARAEAERVMREVYQQEGQLDLFDQNGAEPKADEKPEEPKTTEPKPEPVEEDKAEGKADKKAEKKPAMPPEPTPEESPKPAADDKQATEIEALRRSHPSSWVVAAEWLGKSLKVKYTAGSLRLTVLKKKDMKADAVLSAEDGWETAIEIAQEAAQKASA